MVIRNECWRESGFQKIFKLNRARSLEICEMYANLLYDINTTTCGCKETVQGSVRMKLYGALKA